MRGHWPLAQLQSSGAPHWKSPFKRFSYITNAGCMTSDSAQRTAPHAPLPNTVQNGGGWRSAIGSDSLGLRQLGRRIDTCRVEQTIVNSGWPEGWTHTRDLSTRLANTAATLVTISALFLRSRPAHAASHREEADEHGQARENSLFIFRKQHEASSQASLLERFDVVEQRCAGRSRISSILPASRLATPPNAVRSDAAGGQS